MTDTNIEIIPTLSLVPLESEVLLVTPAMPNDDLLAIYDRLLFVVRESKRLKELMEARMIEWMQTNGDLVVSDTVKYYLGTDKTTKCNDVPAAVEALLSACDGDFKRFCDCLASNAVKHGASKKLLPPDIYSKLFVTMTKSKVEGGPATKELKRSDESFSR